MGFKELGDYCSVCKKHVMIRKNTPNHVLHLILTLITFGLWIFVWIIIGIASASESYKCTICGHKI